MLKKLCLNDRLYPGLDAAKYSKRNEEQGPTVKPESVPHLFESGWTLEDYHELRR